MNSKTRPMMGNEAIAQGAWEAGVRVASAYPGTPSTEILENIAKYPEKVGRPLCINVSFRILTFMHNGRPTKKLLLMWPAVLHFPEFVLLWQ